MGVGGGGEHGEQVPVLGRGHLPLLPRLARGDEDHLVQLELPAGLLGTDQMPDMDGIEGAAHDAEPAASVAFRRGLPAPWPPRRPSRRRIKRRLRATGRKSTGASSYRIRRGRGPVSARAASVASERLPPDTND